jgi:hypothetical protein
MPDPEKTEKSISGFYGQPRGGQTLWASLEDSGSHYSLMNVAFRHDSIWKDEAKGLDIGCDGYRLWKKAVHFPLGRGSQDIRFGGIELDVTSTPVGVRIDKGSGTRAFLAAGEGKIVRFTKGLVGYACLLNGSQLVLNQLTTPMLRGGVHPASVGAGVLDLNVFQLARRVNSASTDEESISIDAELVPSRFCMQQKENLILEAICATHSKLIVGYLPLVDEFNHVYMDQLETEWPKGRVSSLFVSCMRSVDRFLAQVMAQTGPDTLLVVSSDHGAVPYRCMVHVNELLVGAGLTRRSEDGYDLRGSIAYFHPSNCGLIVMQPQASRPDGLRRLNHALEAARTVLGTEIGMVELKGPDPYPAFLYPKTDSKLTGSPPRRGDGTLDATKAGGHHLSPLTPTPWIQAMLGLWSPRFMETGRDLDDIPTENRQLKAFLLDLIH